MEIPDPPTVGKELVALIEKLAKALAATVVIGGVVGSFLWAVGRDPAKQVFLDWYEEASQPVVAKATADRAELRVEIEAIKVAVEQMSKQIIRTRKLNVLEFNGGPHILPPFKAPPGGTIAVGYSLRRTDLCPTGIVVHFINGQLQRVDTSLTYEIPAVQSLRSEEFGYFVVDVKIPEETAPGWYSYAPRAVPECDNFSDVIVPPSPFFEVVAND